MNTRFSYGYAPLLALALVAATATGCAKETVQPLPKMPAEITSGTSATSDNDTTAVSEGLGVSTDIFSACALELGDVESAPKFDFDRSVVTPGDAAILDQVAQCVTTGPLKGRSLQLVGRADSRGTPEYNMTLGAKRAAGVHMYLATLGVPGSRLDDTSRGAIDATGTDDSSRQRDRRVDILLGRK